MERQYDMSKAFLLGTSEASPGFSGLGIRVYLTLSRGADEQEEGEIWMGTVMDKFRV